LRVHGLEVGDGEAIIGVGSDKGEAKVNRVVVRRCRLGGERMVVDW
jgi:hypothetical protein